VILLAEDGAIIAIELADSLRTEGFEVAGPFATCNAAEEWLKTGEPDAAILDNLSKMVPAMRWRPTFRVGVPVIMFSGNDQPPAMAGDWKPTWVTKPLALQRTLPSAEELADALETRLAIELPADPHEIWERVLKH
jgi:DNA-binding response OmpR family regulator